MKPPSNLPPSPPSPPSPTASLWQRSTFARWIRWLFSGRILRRMGIGLVWVVTLIALAYGIENWRGRRAWNSYRAGLEARGLELDLKAMIPKPIPDDRNFAATPLVQSWFDYTTNRFPWRQDDYNGVNLSQRNQGFPGDSRQRMDLAAWAWALQAAASNRAVDYRVPRRVRTVPDEAHLLSAFPTPAAAGAAVLQGLKSSEGPLAELREAGRRPEARYPVVYDLDNPWSILLPHLGAVRGACMRLQLRSYAALASGDTASALDDVLLGFRLMDSLKNEPFLISSLVRAGTVRLMLQPVWEGLVDRRWSDAQLQQIEGRLGGYNFIADLEHSMDSERAKAIWTADLMARGRFSFSQLDGQTLSHSSGGEDDFFRDLLGTLAPRGWYRLEQLNYCRLLDRQMAGVWDARAKRVFPSRVATNANELERAISSGLIGKNLSGVLRHQFFAALSLPGLRDLPRKAAAAQVVVDEARLACALERYRLAEGSFPERLTALVPRWMEHLPADPLTGEPYTYRRTDDGQFVLSSVGWSADVTGSGSARIGFDGDLSWTWQYPNR